MEFSRIWAASQTNAFSFHFISPFFSASAASFSAISSMIFFEHNIQLPIHFVNYARRQVPLDYGTTLLENISVAVSHYLQFRQRHHISLRSELMRLQNIPTTLSYSSSVSLWLARYASITVMHPANILCWTGNTLHSSESRLFSEPK